MFFGYLGLAEGQDFNGIKARVEKDLWASVKGSWTVWPVAHAINFRFIPNEQRLLYINSVQVRWSLVGWLGCVRVGGCKGNAPKLRPLTVYLDASLCLSLLTHRSATTCS